jgi:C-terminal processing protease CtpA/Prc
MQRRSATRVIGIGFGALALLGLVCLTAVQQRTVARLHGENQSLQENAKELEQLRVEVKEAQRLRNQEAEIQQLREENKDLPRLRNEVHQLREQQQEVEALRTANAGLLQAIQGVNLSSNQQAMVAAARKEGAILGISVRSANDPQNAQAPPVSYNGAVVTWIDPNSPVAGSGLKVGDIIVRIDGRPIENAAQLQAEMLARKPGDTVTLDLVRNDAAVRVSVKTRGWPQ